MSLATRIVSQTIQIDGSITIAAGEPVVINRISLNSEGSSANTVTFKTGDGTTTLFSVTIPGNDTRIIKTPFIADQGLKLEGGSGSIIRATVFYKGTGFADTTIAGTVVPQAASQVAFYPLDSTNQGNDTIGSANGTVLGGVTFDATDQNGVVNGAASFDGVDGSGINIGSGLENILDPDSYTISCWLKVSGSGVWTDSTLRWAFTTTASTFANYSAIRKQNSDNELRVRRLADSSASAILISISTTDWFHIVITSDVNNNQFSAYFNGQEDLDSPELAPATGAQYNNTVIGTREAPADSDTLVDAWDGFISNVRIWNTVLTPSEVLILYNNGL